MSTLVWQPGDLQIPRSELLWDIADIVVAKPTRDLLWNLSDIELLYSKDQPRDDHGRFGMTGAFTLSKEEAKQIWKVGGGQKSYEALANRIAVHIPGTTINSAISTNSVYVTIPGAAVELRISDHQQYGANLPNQIMPASYPHYKLGAITDRAIRAAISGARRYQDVPSWEEIKTGKRLSNVDLLSNINHTGMMIALEVPQSVADELHSEETPPHITLAYIPYENIGKRTLDDVLRIVQSCARSIPPLRGEVGGVGRFAASHSSDHKEVEVALVDAPGLNEFRAQLIGKLEKAGVVYSRDHGFLPHITIRYIQPGTEPTPDTVSRIPVDLTTLLVAQGASVKERVPLSGTRNTPGQSKAKALAHFDLAEAGSVVKRSSTELQNLLTGKDQTALITAMAQQAVAQLKRGVPVSQLVFQEPVGFEHKLVPTIVKLHGQAKQHAKDEVRRQLGLKNNFVRASELLYNSDEARDSAGRWTTGTGAGWVTKNGKYIQSAEDGKDHADVAKVNRLDGGGRNTSGKPIKTAAERERILKAAYAAGHVRVSRDGHGVAISASRESSSIVRDIIANAQSDHSVVIDIYNKDGSMESKTFDNPVSADKWVALLSSASLSNVIYVDPRLLNADIAWNELPEIPMLLYSDEQGRDERGRWSAGGGVPVARDYVVSGKVQGVAYRSNTAVQAARIGLAGHVKNLPDGRVAVHAIGTRAQHDDLKEWMAKGPVGAEVKSIEQREAPIAEAKDDSDRLTPGEPGVFTEERAGGGAGEHGGPSKPGEQGYQLWRRYVDPKADTTVTHWENPNNGQGVRVTEHGNGTVKVEGLGPGESHGWHVTHESADNAREQLQSRFGINHRFGAEARVTPAWVLEHLKGKVAAFEDELDSDLFYSEDQPRDEHGRWGSGGTDSKSKEFEAANKIINSYPTDTGKEFYVFRVQGKDDNSLAGKNAADLSGVAQFLDSDSQEFTGSGDHLAVYKVTNENPGQFGTYQAVRGEGKTLSDGIGKRVNEMNWGLAKNESNWYAFGSKGYTAERVKSVPLPDLWHVSAPGQIVALHNAVFGKDALSDLFYSPEQPRDSHGRWGEGSGELSAAERIQAVKDKMAADPKVQEAERLLEARGDVRNDPGVLDKDGKYTEAAALENGRVASAFISPDSIPPAGTQPTAVIMVGRPGAGKSTLLGNIGSDLPTSVNINSDSIQERLQGFQPQLAVAYHGRAADINKNYLTPAAVDGSHNITLDVVDNRERTVAMVQDLHDKGYHVAVIHARVDEATSVERVYHRFAKPLDAGGGRYVPIRAVEGYGDRPQKAYDALKGVADEWRTYDTSTKQPRFIEGGSRTPEGRSIFKDRPLGRLGAVDTGRDSTGWNTRSEEDARVVDDVRPAVTFLYSQDQPRDERGRFGSGISSYTAPTKEVQAEHVTAIKDYLSSVDAMMSPHVAEGITTPSRFVLDNGRAFNITDKTFSGGRMTQKECYRNAALKMMDTHGLTYVEGYVHIGPLAIEHAWLSDKSGNVIDPTLNEKNYTKGSVYPRAYFGVPFNDQYVSRALVRSGMYGLITGTNHQLLEGKDKAFRTEALSDLFYSDDQPRDYHGRWGDNPNVVLAGTDRSTWPEHIKALVVPPAWTNIKYHTDPKADLLVVGRDAAGRDQYVYSAKHAETQSAAKFQRIKALDKQYQKIDKSVARDQAKGGLNGEHADALRTVMETGIRPGSERDTGSKVEAFGATTLLGSHVVSDENGTRLQFVAGKSHGVEKTFPVMDKATADMLIARAQVAGPKGQLFPNVTDGSLRDYTHSQGAFKTKDFRTLTASRTAMDEISSRPTPTTEKEYKVSVRAVAQVVSARLGNTPTVALQSYIPPQVFSKWRMSAGI